MSEFELPPLFEPESVPEEKRKRMYTYVKDVIDEWNEEDFMNDVDDLRLQQIAQGGTKIEYHFGITVCANPECCEFSQRVPLGVIQCGKCNQMNTLQPCDEQFFLDHFIQIAASNEGMMQSAYHSTMMPAEGESDGIQ